MTRLKVRFPDTGSLEASLSAEAPGLAFPAVSLKRNFIAVESQAAAPSPEGAGALSEYLDLLKREFGGEAVEDVQYDPDAVSSDFLSTSVPEVAGTASMDDVLQLIEAPYAWAHSRGEGVAIAIVDSGVCGERSEFAMSRRQGGWAPPGEDPWADWSGHGTMCAAIACASRVDGGVIDGVAPGAGLISCRTHYFDTDLTNAYDYLIDRVRNDGLRIIASNSFGKSTGQAPAMDPNSDFVPALEEAISVGITVVFSAGNNHQLAGGQSGDCHPNSIWLHKSRDDVLVVAACQLDGSMWHYSSRGPGQFWGAPGAGSKPDVTAPTPRDGTMAWGDSTRTFPIGWGTSGACPQGAGLAAILASVDPSATASSLFDVIRSSSRNLGHGANCQGTGLISCRDSVDMVLANP
jgi:serine protease AprX